MTWQIISSQNQGTRHEQQDHGGAWTSRDGKSVLAVIADGVGGHRGGAQASRMAVETAHALWEKEPPAAAEAKAFLEKISRAAHETIGGPAHSGRSPRTTWVALLAQEKTAYWVHSGDSRLYYFAAGRLHFHTRDHTLVQLLIAHGEITEEDVPDHPDRAVLLQSLGGPEYQPVEFAFSKIGKNDQFILCTDGVWSDLEGKELEQLAKARPQRRARMADDLVYLAVKRGGKRADNALLLSISRHGSLPG